MTIQFKTKVREEVDGRKYINYKKTLTQFDVIGEPVGRIAPLYNSQLFPIILKRAYREVIGEYKRWDYIDELPKEVSLDTSGFLAICTIVLPDTF